MGELSRLELVIDSKGVVTANGNLDLFKQKSKAAEKSAQSFGDQVTSSMFGTVTAANLAATGIQKTAGAIAGLVESALSASGQLEMIKANLITVMGSADLAGKTFEDLKKFAAATPFEMPGITDSAIMLKQSGVAAGDLISTLRALGDASGGSQEKLNRIAINYAQIMSVGKAATMDIKQFAMAGLPIYDALGKALGVNNEQLGDMISNGEVTKEVIVQAFKDMTAEGGAFYKGMERGATTLDGKISTLKDTWKSFEAALVDTTGVSVATKKTTDYLTRMLSEMTSNFEFFSANNAVNTGGGSNEQILSVAEARIKAITDKIEENTARQNHLLSIQGYGSNSAWSEVKKLEEENKQLDFNLTYWKKRKDAIIDVQAADAAYQRGKAASDALGQQFASNLALQNGLDTDPDNAQVRAIKEQIAAQKALYDTFYKGKDTAKIASNIAYLESELEKLIKTKDKLLGWQKVLKDTLSVEDVSTGRNAVAEYEQNLEDSMNGALAYAQMTGGKVSDVYIEYATKVDSAIKTLLSSGQFSPSDNAVLGLLGIERNLKSDAAGGFDFGISKSNGGIFGTGFIKDYNDELNNAISLTDQLADKQRKYNWTTSGASGYGAFSGTDVGTFISGTAQGGIQQGAVDMFIGAMVKVAGSSEEFQRTLNAATEVLGPFYRIFQDIGKAVDPIITGLQPFSAFFAQMIELNPQFIIFINELKFFGWLLENINNIIQMVVDEFDSTFGTSFGKLKDATDSQTDAARAQAKTLQDQIAAQQRLVSQLEDLRKQIQEDELYYASQRTHLNALYGNTVTPVNDAIIAPGGRIVTTHPDDYLIATKTPGSLQGSAATKYNFQIINNTGVEAKATAQTSQNADGSTNVIMLIEKVVASGLSKGTYDSSLEAQKRRVGGRTVSS